MNIDFPIMTASIENESQAIRQQMRRVRARMPYSMDDALDDAKQLQDWRFYIQSFPFASFISCATIAYLAVPTRRDQSASDRPVVGRQQRQQQEEAIGKSSAVAALTSVLTSFAIKAAASYLTGRVSNAIQNGMARQNKD